MENFILQAPAAQIQTTHTHTHLCASFCDKAKLMCLLHQQGNVSWGCKWCVETRHNTLFMFCQPSFCWAVAKGLGVRVIFSLNNNLQLTDFHTFHFTFAWMAYILILTVYFLLLISFVVFPYHCCNLNRMIRGQFEWFKVQNSFFYILVGFFRSQGMCLPRWALQREN